MASLRCCTFNCRGWNTGYLTLKPLIDSLDLCFVQEHWLLNDHLHKIGEISSDFLSVSISGVDHDHFLVGRPYGGCSPLCLSSHLLILALIGFVPLNLAIQVGCLF